MAEDSIDDSLYSRQRYVLGDRAMQRMAESAVLLYGMGGLGVEIAKNIVLAGVKTLTVQDSRAASAQDLATQFFIRQADVDSNKNRAEASAPHLAELNPYVTVRHVCSPLDESTDLGYLVEFTCVILTEVPINIQLRVNQFCRTQSPPIKFISGDVYGLFCTAFCDFGDEFEVIDPNGEEPKETFISQISKANPGIVTSLEHENKLHGFESGDTVTFREVGGMTVLNGTQCQIQVLSPFKFRICDTSGDEFSQYTDGGIATQVKVPKKYAFKSLESQLLSPDTLLVDLSKVDAPQTIHLGYLALQKFQKHTGQLPNIWCSEDAERILALAKQINSEMVSKVDRVDEALLQKMSYTCRGCLPPLCATLGGILAQEALKAITGKFTPLMQWIHMDAGELLNISEDTDEFEPQSDRYDSLRACLGDDLCRKIACLRLFMDKKKRFLKIWHWNDWLRYQGAIFVCVCQVGCGAIGCEMLKNYALLGVATEQKGLVTITDHDLIEKSNLNRQFLFRPHHIRQAKSTTAAQATLHINSAIKINAQQHKVSPNTESNLYNDSFFEAQDVIVNALDNIEARRYMDSRCVTNQRPLLESGTMGAKGHVQVIVPHLTESYASQHDPPDEDYPYCTLKSFPAQIEHCIQWARDKFESSFTYKPQLLNKFWSTNASVEDIIQRLHTGECPDGSIAVSRIMHSRPHDWSSCVRLARLKFDKYYNHRAKQLLHVFPLDAKLSDGSPFWQSPKRPPTPLVFDTANELHMSFIVNSARLFAFVNGIPVNQQDLCLESLCSILSSVVIPQFRPSNKKIETDDEAQKPEDNVELSGDELEDAANRMQALIDKSQLKESIQEMCAASFEKDDDDNGHIDLITAASNLRAQMYNIESADRLKTKKIAGRIVPAIGTTTATVAGLVTIELLKLAKKCRLEDYKNCFLNLALPVILLSEPGPVQWTKIKNDLSVTMWDRWDIHGNKLFTLQQFLQHFKATYGLEMSMVVQGVKMVYVPIMPGHNKRLPQTMLKLLRRTPEQRYTDLVVSFKGSAENDEDIAGPPIRYHFST